MPITASINYNVRVRTMTLAEFHDLTTHIAQHFSVEKRNDGVVRYQCKTCNIWVGGICSIESVITHAADHHVANCDKCYEALHIPKIKL
jgi:hypothetical protein